MDDKESKDIKKQYKGKDDRREKVRISIGTELISMISLILLVALSVMIFIATFFFRDDSEKRIEENNHKISEVVSQKVRTDFISILDTAANAAEKLELINRRKGANKEQIELLSKRFFQRDKDIIFIGIAKKGPGKSLSIKASMTNKEFLKRNKLSSGKILKTISIEKKFFKKSFQTLSVVHNISPHFGMPIIGISNPYIKRTDTTASSILIIILSMNRFLEAVKSPGITKTFIVNGEGDIIAHHDSSLVSAKVSYKKLAIVKEMLTSPRDNIQTKYADENGLNYLGSFYKVGFAGTGVITSVEEDKAFEAVYQIRRRNLLITVIVLSVAILIVYIFSKTIIRPITRLVRATKEIEEGTFNIEMKDYPRNELGMLMRSFQDMGHGLAEREKMKDAFGKFVNPEIAEMVLRDEIALGGERKTAAVFFSDIRSFTSISEKLEPEEVVEFLNQYMSRMVECVNETHGVVDKFIGDAVMATWGAPVSYGNDTENAINGALLMRKALLDFNKGRGGDKKPIIKIGCGINTGAVLAGQIGSQDKMEYTVIGDAVNLASRIEQLNKPFGTDILISEDSYNLVKGKYVLAKMKKIKVTGKEEPQQIYAVLGRKDDPDSPKTLAELRTIIGAKKGSITEDELEGKEQKFEILVIKEDKLFTMTKDLIVPISCTIAIAASSFALYLDFTKKVEPAGTEQIGTITFKKKVAERKYSGTMIWEELEQKTPVYNYDSIRTSDDSISIIKFKDDSEIEINENTFLLLSWTDKGATVDFSRGSISARTLSAKATKLKIVSEGTEVEVNKGDIQLSKTADKKINLNVATGIAIVATEKGTDTVTEDKSAVISKEKTEVKKKTISLEYPKPDSYFVTFKDKKAVAFKWKSVEKGSVKLEVSDDISFGKILDSRETGKQSSKTGFEPGTYYWRISREHGKNKEISPARKFIVLKDITAKPIIPKDKSNFKTLQENPLISLQWTASTHATAYKVLITTDPKLKKEVQVLTTKNTSISTDKLGIGKYFWTVKNKYDFSEDKELKNNFINTITISKEKKIAAPVILAPKENEIISGVKLATTGIVCNWSSHDEIEKYEIEISKDKKFKDVILKTSSNNNFYKLSKDLNPGKYYLRVTGLTSREYKTKPSKQRTFAIMGVKKLLTVSPGDGASINIFEDQKLVFEWNDPNKGNNYFFELAKDKKFGNLIYKSYTSKPQIVVSEKLKGLFYWRVSLVDRDKKVLMSSNVARARVVSTLKQPEVNSPKNHHIVDMTYRDYLTFSWKSVKDATHYRIRLYQFTSRYNKQILDINITGSSLDFKKIELLDKGNFYWEIQALKYRDGKVVRKSRARKSFFSIKLLEPTKAPEIISSDTLYIE